MKKHMKLSAKEIQEKIIFYKNLLKDESLSETDRIKLEAKTDALMWVLLIAN